MPAAIRQHTIDAAELEMGAAKMKVSCLLTTGSPGGPPPTEVLAEVIVQLIPAS